MAEPTTDLDLVLPGPPDAFPPAPVTAEQWAAARAEGRWVPTTLAAAEWTAQRLSEAQAELDGIKGRVSEYIAQVREWAEHELKAGRGLSLAQSIDLFENGLKVYARRIREDSIDRKGEPKIKTITLPSAELRTVKARDRKPKFTVTDLEALLEWAEQAAPDAIYREIDIKRLKLLVIADENEQEFVINSDGERVPGVSFTWDQDEREPGVTIHLTNKELTR